MESLYTILGVNEFSTAEEVRKAYLSRILLVHPDKSSSDNSVEELAKLKNAYDKLKDPKTKEKYDKYLKGIPTNK